MVDGSWIDRRVHTLSIEGIEDNRTVVTRRVSLAINHSRFLEISGEPTGAPAHLVPLGLFRKDLLLDFDVTDASNASLVAISRERETYLATEFALSSVAEPRPSHVIIERIRGYLSSQRGSALPMRDFEHQLLRMHASEAYGSADREWIRCALANRRFIANVEVLRQHHILIVSVPRPENDFVVKVRRREVIPDTSVQDDLDQEFPAATRLLRFEVPDFGWPVSDHLRVGAVERTQISDLFPRDVLAAAPDIYRYITTGDSERRTIYQFNPILSRAGLARRRNSPIYMSFGAVIVPRLDTQQRASRWFVRFIIAFLFLGGIGDLVSSMSSCMSPSRSGKAAAVCVGPLSSEAFTESIITVSFLSATLFLAYIFREGESALTWRFLRSIRRGVVLTLALAWSGAALLLVPRTLAPTLMFAVGWLLLGLIALVLYRFYLAPKWNDMSETVDVADDSPWAINVYVRG